MGSDVQHFSYRYKAVASGCRRIPETVTDRKRSSPYRGIMAADESKCLLEKWRNWQ